MKKLRIGIAGLGRAFALTAPAFEDPRVEVAAGADPRPEARERFRMDYGGRAYATVEELCADEGVDVVYVATPHELHCANACLAAARGKHVLVEKPMALTAEDCRAMIQAAQRGGVQLVVGPSHGFDAPIALARRLVDGGAYGRVRMITAINFTDFVYRPRRPGELGTGAVLNQGAHHVDIARRLAGGAVRSVRAYTGDFDPARRTSGAYSCLLGFDNGAFATLVYSGYGHFDSDELMGWVGELGQRKDPAAYGAARRALRGDEQELKNARNYGGPRFTAPAAVAHEHFGPIVVSCEKADLRPLPDGVWIYADEEKRFEPLPPPARPRTEVIDELYAAVVENRPPVHSGESAMATLQVCLAIAESARTGKEVAL